MHSFSSNVAAAMPNSVAYASRNFMPLQHLIHTKGPIIARAQKIATMALILKSCWLLLPALAAETDNEMVWSTPEQSLYSQLKDLMAAGVQVICGLLFLPTIKLFLDLPNDSIDIHGFGSMGNIADGLPHYCPSLYTVMEMGEKGVFPRPLAHHSAWLSKQRIVIPDFIYLSIKLKK